MTSQITIIGLGQIGASIGLALEDYKKDIYRVGHDKNMTAAKDAQKLGAVDNVVRNLPSSTQDADIIILSLPFSEIYDTLKYIAQDVKKDALIIDTGVGKAAVQNWIKELLPAGQAYIGLAPVINPLYLHEEEFGVNAARKHLFANTATMIATPIDASAEAVDAAVTLVRLMGSQPLFSDILEVDGVMASAHLLPQLTAAALLNTTVGSPGWAETRKIAGRAFAETTRSILHQEGAASLTEAVFANRENIGYKLNEMITSLQQIKALLDADDKATLREMLSETEEGRVHWMNERVSADWLMSGDGQSEKVEGNSMMAQFFGFKDRKLKD